MDSGSIPTSSDPATLFVIVTSFKIWIVVYFITSFVLELFGWAIPLTIAGTLAVYLLVNKFKVPSACESAVADFFGAEIRPKNADIETFATVRTRLVSPGRTLQQMQQNGHAMTVIAHRGAGLDAPENSISAFRHCKQRGCTAVEFDVTMTKDSVAVVFHDENLVRITGIDREINDMTYDELRQVDISVLHPLGEKFPGERVPTFEEAVTTCLSLGLKFFVDVKDSDEKMATIILEMFKKYPDMYGNAVITSFSAKAIFMIRRQDPRIIGCMSWRPCYHRYVTWNGNWTNLELRNPFILHTWLDMLWDCVDQLALNHFYWWFLGLSGYLLNKDCITKEASYRWVKKGMRLFLWTVNSPLEKLHLVQNVQLGYLTDTLDAGDLTTSSTSANYTTLAVNKLKSSSHPVSENYGNDSHHESQKTF